MRVVADLLAYEEAHNPAGGVEESDPYGILRRGDSSIVTDAGANDLLKVTDRGRISTLAVFPSRMVDFQGGEVPDGRRPDDRRCEVPTAPITSVS